MVADLEPQPSLAELRLCHLESSAEDIGYRRSKSLIGDPGLRLSLLPSNLLSDEGGKVVEVHERCRGWKKGPTTIRSRGRRKLIVARLLLLVREKERVELFPPVPLVRFRIRGQLPRYSRRGGSSGSAADLVRVLIGILLKATLEGED